MYNAITNTWQLTNVLLWIDFGISLTLLGFLTFILMSNFRKKSSIVFTICFDVTILLSWFFGLTLLWAISLMIGGATIAMLFIQNSYDLRTIFNLQKRKSRKSQIDRVYDKHEVCVKVAIAVQTLSKTKTGALITFERGDDLDVEVKSGTILDAPITPELLVTIFYPGTRLHDGAVVIRKDLIHAASVYYKPTTRPLTGKYGSRHRAAIGISEINDSITVIVSEETGRISLAQNGELIPTNQEGVLDALEEALRSGEMID